MLVFYVLSCCFNRWDTTYNRQCIITMVNSYTFSEGEGWIVAVFNLIDTGFSKCDSSIDFTTTPANAPNIKQ